MSDELIREAATAFHRQIPARRVGELEPARACASAIVAQWDERLDRAAAAAVALIEDYRNFSDPVRLFQSTWLERRQVLEDLLTEVFAEWAKTSVLTAVEKFCKENPRRSVEFAEMIPNAEWPETYRVVLIDRTGAPTEWRNAIKEYIGVGDTWGAAMAQALDTFELREDQE